MVNIIDYNKDIKGISDRLPKEKQGIVMGIVANFHYQNKHKTPDDSTEVLEITSGELNDCLARCLITR